jgi:hypothetical protein
VPYHYGRWSFGIGIGWFWVPPARGYAFWGPGYVGWSYTSFYVAWVPLAPYETYYGYGNYGPHSVNITNININKTHVNVYKNVHVNNAVTAVHHDTFTRGRHVDLKLNENPFIKNGTHVGRPLIAPERATMMPIVRESQRTQTVAQATRQMPTKALREAQSVSVAKTENQHRPITPANAPVTNKSLNSQSDNRTNRLAPARPIAPPVTDGTTGRKIIADPIPKQTVSIPSGKQRNTVSAPKPLELPRQTFNRPPDRVPQGTSRNIAPPLPERRVSQAPVNTGLNAPQKTTQPRTSGHIDQSNPAPSRKSVETVQPRQNTPAGSSQAVEKAPRAGNTVARGMR